MTPASDQRSVSPLPPAGVEVGIVSLGALSRGDRRLDAETYLTAGHAVQGAVAAAFPHAERLGSLARVWQPSRLKGIQVGREHGVPFLAATQAFDIWPTPRKWLAASRTPELNDRFVKPGWLLVTCSGAVGDAILSYNAHAGVLVSHDLMRMECEDPNLTGYIYAFFRTTFGRSLMQSSHYGNVIKHLEVEHFEELRIPIVDELVQEIGAKVTRTYALRDAAYEHDMESRRKFERALGGEPVISGESFVVTSTNADSRRRRLDAFAHNPATQAILEKYRRSALAVVPLGTVADARVPSRFKRVFGGVGTVYLDSEPIFKINPPLDKILMPATAIAWEQYFVRRGCLLVACSGQIYGINGQAILATKWHEGKVITQHIMRVVPKGESIRAGYLQVVLSHPSLGQPLVVSRAHGTSVPELDPVDIEALPIPRLADSLEREISDLAERASELRMEADECEDGVVARLEQELARRLDMPATKRANLRPDVAETAFRVMREATGEAPKTRPPTERTADDRNAEAVRRGVKGGRGKRRRTG